jgi:prephenate dehydrogenase
VVTDVASTKAALLERADAAGLRFVGGHPMAGLDVCGYAAGRADLFIDRPWVIVPGKVANSSDVERVTALVGACRARAVLMDGRAHDEAVAGISHLPLILAVALVEAVVGSSGALREDWPAASALAASGWSDMTRLARGDPAMGAGIVVTNAAALAERLSDLQSRLDAWRTELERLDGPDELAVTDRFRAARASLADPP